MISIVAIVVVVVVVERYWCEGGARGSDLSSRTLT